MCYQLCRLWFQCNEQYRSVMLGTNFETACTWLCDARGAETCPDLPRHQHQRISSGARDAQRSDFGKKRGKRRGRYPSKTKDACELSFGRRPASTRIQQLSTPQDARCHAHQSRCRAAAKGAHVYGCALGPVGGPSHCSKWFLYQALYKKLFPTFFFWPKLRSALQTTQSRGIDGSSICNIPWRGMCRCRRGRCGAVVCLLFALSALALAGVTTPSTATAHCYCRAVFDFSTQQHAHKVRA